MRKNLKEACHKANVIKLIPNLNKIKKKRGRRYFFQLLFSILVSTNRQICICLKKMVFILQKLCYSIKEALMNLTCCLAFPMSIWSYRNKVFRYNSF